MADGWGSSGSERKVVLIVQPLLPRSVVQSVPIVTAPPELPTMTGPGDPLAMLFSRHWREMLRLAALLLDDPGQREEVVQEAFLKLHGRRLRDPDAAAAYLRQCVVNLCRSRLRRRLIAARLP